MSPASCSSLLSTRPCSRRSCPSTWRPPICSSSWRVSRRSPSPLTRWSTYGRADGPRPASKSPRTGSNMKFLDRRLRDYRVRVALREVPAAPRAVFDIGCDDGFLLSKLGDERTRRDGCDPVVSADAARIGNVVLRGFFPDVVKSAEPFY